MKKLFLCLLLVSPLVFAFGEKTFNWVPPTEYELQPNQTTPDPLPQSEIAGYDIECDGKFLINVPNVPIDTDQYQAPPGTFAGGPHACQAYTVTIQGVRSAPSNTVNFIVAPGIPKAPIFAVQ